MWKKTTLKSMRGENVIICVTLLYIAAELESGLTSSVVFLRSMRSTWPKLKSYVEFLQFLSFLEVIRTLTENYREKWIAADSRGSKGFERNTGSLTQLKARR